MRQPLVLVAASGLAREVLEAVRDAEAYEVIGLVDDNSDLWGEVIDDVKVLGGLEVVGDLPDAAVLLCAGKGVAREALASRLGLDDDRYATVVHPTAIVPPSCAVGAGSILLAGCVLTTTASLGRHVVAMPNVVLTHDDVIDDFATLCAGVAFGGSVHVGSRAYIGMNASVREGRRVGTDATIGMGAVVLTDIPVGETWAGVPARRLHRDGPVDDPIPLVDLKLQHDRVAHDVEAGFEQVLANTSFVLGPSVQAFERKYADFCGVGHCIGVGNGTDAIELALRAVGVGPGDEVITAANTFVATAEAIVRTGATLVLADCDEHFLLDSAAARAAITSRTKAIVPVHMYGQMAPMERYAADGIHLIEDAAQSQGALRRGGRSGSMGVVGATSFYPGKNLGAYGDAGAITTDDTKIAERIRGMRNHGGIRKYEHLEVGVNSRLDELQAVVLAAKLRRLEAWNDERRAAAERYGALLQGLDDVGVPEVMSGNEHVWHLYVVRVPRRDEVLARLNAAGIGAGIHYPVPVHLLPAFADHGWETGAFPVAERVANEILSLPIYPGITPAQQERVVKHLAKAMT